MFSIAELNYVMRIQRPNLVVNWYAHHLDACALNDFDEINISLFPDYKGYLQTYADAGMAFTVVNRSDIMVMFGCWQLWPGVWEAWMIPSRHIGRQTVALHRGTLAFFEYLGSEMGVKRLQFTVHSSNATACVWAKRCYFKREGTMRGFGPDGADYPMYARMF